MTGTTTTSELELAIGEAQQIYPEIWRHLDEARGLLAERGEDVSLFDQLRRHERLELGVTGVDVTEQMDAFGRTQQVKTATFNAGGYQRARAAIQSLMTAMPEVDWAAVAREEDRQIKAAGSLHAGKWLGMAKTAGIAAVLAVCAVVTYRLIWNVGEDDSPRRRPAKALSPQDRKAMEAVNREWNERAARIDQLRSRIGLCDRDDLQELARLLREDRQLTAASKLETEPCVPQRPPCTDVREATADRLAAELGYVRDPQWTMQCEGVVLLRDGKVVQGLAIAIAARSKGDVLVEMRGVTSADGTRNVVPFSPSPLGAAMTGVANLDHDGSDEIVFVSPESLVISRIQPAGFADIEGPEVRRGCSADVNIEADFRRDRKGRQQVLVLTVPVGQKGRACLEPGRHYFTLQGDELVESE